MHVDESELRNFTSVRRMLDEMLDDISCSETRNSTENASNAETSDATSAGEYLLKGP